MADKYVRIDAPASDSRTIKVKNPSGHVVRAGKYRASLWTGSPAGMLANPTYDPETYKLPIMLVHGLNGRDESIALSYRWGRIPARLRKEGYGVWFSNQDSWTGVEHNADQIVQSVHEVLALTGAPKLHMIAHSKGGVDARAAINRPGMSDLVFSFTTLATPHHGTRLSSFLDKIPIIMPYVVAPIMNIYARHQGDPEPNSIQVLHDTTLEAGRRFANLYPVPPEIHYHSYAFLDERPHFHIPNPGSMFMIAFDGKTDGVVPLESTEQPNRVIVRVVGKQKVTHDEPNDLHERDIDFILPDGESYGSAPEFLVALADHLTEEYMKSVGVIEDAEACSGIGGPEALSKDGFGDDIVNESEKQAEEDIDELLES